MIEQEIRVSDWLLLLLAKALLDKRREPDAELDRAEYKVILAGLCCCQIAEIGNYYIMLL